MLDKVKAYGIGAVEITTGGWGGCHYVSSARDLLDNHMGKVHSQTIHDTV